MGSIRQTARNRRLQPSPEAKESLDRTLAVEERNIHRIHIAGNQLCAVGVGARDQDGGNIENIRCQPRCNKFLHRFPRRDQDFTPHMAALLRGGQLILKVNRRSPCLNHRLHEFKSVERAAKPCFRVGHNR